MQPEAAASPPPVQTRSQPRWLLWIGLGCFALLVLAGTCVGLGVMAWRNQDQELTRLAKVDTKDVCEAWDSDVLWARFDKASHKLERQKIDELLTSFGKCLGPIVEVGDSNMTKVFAGTNGRTATVVTQVEFEKAMGTTSIVYIYEENQWRIHYFRVDSPALAPLLESDSLGSTGH